MHTEKKETKHPLRICVSDSRDHGLINNKLTSKLTCIGSLRHVFICLRLPPLLGFRLRWSSNFVGSESGQIQRVELLQNIVSNRTQHPPPPTSSQPHSLCTLYSDTGNVGRWGDLNWTREKVRGATVHKTVSKIPTWLTVSPVYKHLPQSPFTGKLL